ncbi:integrase core domain-containing protein [Corynebacterium accolens]|uniref:integrase core domain-containing protein n=2 Tax=Corynebacterium accolens TaxID=38284 RepID=UPI0032B7F35E
MSAWSTTSDLPSMALTLPPGVLVTYMTMLWLKTLRPLTRGELIHTRRWDGVVEVEIATFEWVSWWNETRLHQSLGYRTPVEVETEFWKQNLPQAIMEDKANA